LNPTVAETPLANLKPAPWNPRTIRENRFKNLCESIQADPEFLWRRPVLATADGTIYAGNMRYRAAAHIGLATVPAIVEDVPEKLAKERALRDNAQWGDWHEDQLAEMVYQMAADGSDVKLLGIEDDELARLLGLVGADGTEGLTDPDELPENVPTRSKLGDLWLLGEHRVLCGDSTRGEDVARLMNGEQAALMATDPPYLVDYDGGDHPQSYSNKATKRDKSWDAYKDPEAASGFFASFIRAALPHLRKDAAIYQWHADRRRATVDAAWQASGLLLHQVLIWAKARPVLTRNHFMVQHEPCAYGWLKGNIPKRKPPANSKTVWEINQIGESDGIHPTQKPVEISRRPLAFHTRAGDVCYEPFGGSGSQLIAAQEMGRRCYAMEIAPAYVDVILARWEAFTGKTAVLDAGS
jgi:DNA modification methylase